MQHLCKPIINYVQTSWRSFAAFGIPREGIGTIATRDSPRPQHHRTHTCTWTRRPGYCARASCTTPGRILIFTSTGVRVLSLDEVFEREKERDRESAAVAVGGRRRGRQQGRESSHELWGGGRPRCY